MTVRAIYKGRLPHLRGEAAMLMIKPATYRPELVRPDRVYAQFDNPEAQRRLGRQGYQSRARHKHLGYGWHHFLARDFYVPVFEIEQTCRACPSQWEGQLLDGRYFYVRYRSGRLRIGFGDSPWAAVDAAIAKVESYPPLQGVIGDQYDGYLEWPDVEPAFVIATAL